MTRTYEIGELRAEVAMDDLEMYARLMEQRASIDEECGTALLLNEWRGRKAGRVYARKDARLEEKDKWPDCFGWILQNLVRLKEVIRRRVAAIEEAAERDGGSGQPPDVNR